MNKQVCTFCVMDGTDATNTFDDQGRCRYCRRAEQLAPQLYFPNAEGEKRLSEMVNRIKADCKNDPYDCLVGVSGGLDSTYVMYLGYKLGLRMLAIHVDDGLDTDIARNNIRAICEKTGTKLKTVSPDMPQYKDLTLAFLKASVPNLAIPQDNILQKALYDEIRDGRFRYFLSGGNYAHEIILQSMEGGDVVDLTHIRDIHRKFGSERINRLRLLSPVEKYFGSTVFSKITYVKPLNYIDYDLQRCISELRAFCGYVYPGGKHYECVLTRFMQCWYLPQKYGIDKRKSHLSSLIVSGQLTRQEAVRMLQQPAYASEELKEYDFNFLADYFGISRSDFDQLVGLPARRHSDYKNSSLFKFQKLGVWAKRLIRKKIR